MNRLTFLHRSRLGFRGREGLQAGAIVLGLIWALSVAVATIMVACFWIMFSSRETFYLGGLISASALISTAMGGMISGRLAGTLGWLHGILVSVFYSLLLIVFAGLVTPEDFSWITMLPKGFLLLLAGVLGGMLGVNLPYSRRSYRRLPY